MNRRSFLAAAGTLGAGVLWPPLLRAGLAPYARTLVLLELKGGNDALNTLIPYADAAYRALRPSLAIPREQVIALDEQRGLHPALAPLLARWRSGALALIDSVGHPARSLSHFRSIDIWDTASDGREHPDAGWLGRTFQREPPPPDFAADGLLLGRGRSGPLAGAGARIVAVDDPARLRRQARRVSPRPPGGTGAALGHVLAVERSVVEAAERLVLGAQPRVRFPAGAFGRSLQTAARLLAGPGRVAAIKVTLDGFDTHRRQAGAHERLLGQLAEGLAAFARALEESGRWRDTLLLTCSEFGRRPRENGDRGTDHGTAGMQLALGGAVRGGLYGPPPALARLDGAGNPPHAVDFRAVYATVLERWWGVPSAGVLGSRHAPLGFLS